MNRNGPDQKFLVPNVDQCYLMTLTMNTEEQRKKEAKLAVMEDKFIEMIHTTISSIMSSANSQDIKEQIAETGSIQQGVYKATAQ